MVEDVKKFMDLMGSDEALQQKFRAAAEGYAGDRTQESAFRDLIAPIAEEAGLHFTLEELQEYAAQQGGALRDLSADELDQVAAGSGFGVSACYGPGIGLGYTNNGEDGGGCCIGIGFGDGVEACGGKGVGKGIW
ncbi:MAG: Nif11-like leader peptide family natural product precursor [Eggerthellaceae bacterium]|nr:Nif11-like leader peptide family natural product precursor [Eggerthellaceae bacterium]